MARDLKRPTLRLTQANVRELQAYDWPGNVRELRNVIERAVIVSRGGELRFDLSSDQETAAPRPASAQSSPIQVGNTDIEVVPESEMRQRERQNLIAALESTGWTVYGSGGAAELLGIKPSTLASRIKKMGIVRPS